MSWRDPKSPVPIPHGPSCLSPAVLDPCVSSPCLNGGTCTNTQDPVSYHCTCPLAFTGKDCGIGEKLGWGMPRGSLGLGQVLGAWRASVVQVGVGTERTVSGGYCATPREML